MKLALMMTAALTFGSVIHDADQYIPRLLKIRTKQGTIIPFRPNRAQIELERQKRAAIAAGKPRRFLVLKNRQVGFSTHEVARNFHLVSTRFNMRAVTLAHKTDVAEILFRTANLFYDKLHPDLRPRRLSPRNKQNLDYPATGSYYGIGTAKDASFGRSNTINRVHWSEVAYTPNSYSEQEKLLTSLRHAAKHGEIVLESTANGFGNLFEFMVSEALAGRDDWTLIFVPWWFDDDCRIQVNELQAADIMATLSDVEKILVEKHGLTADQIAFRRSENSTAQKRADFPQEFPEDPRTCFLTSGISYFNMEVVDHLLRTTLAIPATEIPGGEVTIWEAPQPGVQYVGGVDTSEGIKGCDPNGIGIMRRDTGAQVCSVHGLFDPDDLGDLTIQYARMFNGALMGVERNNHGHAVLRRIRSKAREGASQFDGGWLYHHSPTGKREGAKMGWPTDQVTRPVMISDLRSAVNDQAIHIRDLTMLYECRTFHKQSNGKWEADSGKHDDSIFKWAIALQMRAHKIVKPGFFVASAGI